MFFALCFANFLIIMMIIMIMIMINIVMMIIIIIMINFYLGPKKSSTQDISR